MRALWVGLGRRVRREGPPACAVRRRHAGLDASGRPDRRAVVHPGDTPAARTWGVALALAVSAAVAAAAPADDALLRDRALAATCAACHGTDGRPPPDAVIPPLAGLDADAFMRRMAAFKAGAPEATVMPQIARGYSDAQIARLAAYFAGQPAVPRR